MGLVGNLEDLGLGEILQIISFSQKSGKLSLSSRSREGYIVFDKGRVIRADSTMIKETTGDILVSKNIITQQVLDNAISVFNSSGFNQNMATVLNSSMNVPMSVIDDVVRERVEKAVFSVFLWTDGNFAFELDDFKETPEFLSTDNLYKTIEPGLDPQFLSMEGSRILDEMTRDGTLKALSDDEGGELSDEAGSIEMFDDLGDDIPSEPTSQESGIAGAVPGQAPHLYDNFASIKDFMAEMSKDETFLSDAGSASPKVEESKGMYLLKEMLGELSRPITISEIVLLILRFSSELFSRTVLFAVKKDEFVGLGEVGVELDDEIAAKVVKHLKISIAEPSILHEAFEKQRTVVTSIGGEQIDKFLISKLGGLVPEESFASPVVVRGKVTMVLYGDNALINAPIGDASSLEIFLGQASMAIERVALEELAQ